MTTLTLTPVTPAAATLSAAAAGGAFIFADYIINGDGATSSAIPLRAGLAAVPSSDFGTVLQTCLTALKSTAGNAVGTILVAGSHTNSSVAALPPVPTGTTPDSRGLRIIGLPGSKVTLSSGGPRFLDFGKTANYDTFQNIELRDLLVDCNNVGGRHHVVLGTYIAGVQTTRINVSKLRIENVRTINVPSDATLTNHRLNVWIVPDMPVGSSACSIDNVLVENVRFEGGNMGVVLGASGTAAASLTVDEVHVRNWWHSLMAVQSSNFSSSNVQIGSRATVGRITVKQGFGQYSGDVGVEIDNAQHAVVEDVKIEDAYNIAFLTGNFAAAASVPAQKIVYQRCQGRRVTATAGVGFRIDDVANGGIVYGTIVLRDCGWRRSDGGEPAVSGADGVLLTQTVDFHRLVVDGFDYVVENLSYASGTNANPDAFGINSISTTRSPHVLLRNCRFYITGTRDNATGGVLAYSGIQLAGSTYSFEIDNPYFHYDITNMSSTGTRMIELGRESAGLRGTIRGLRLGSIVGDTSPRGIQIRGTATLVIANAVQVEDCDFVRMTAGNEILFVDNTNQDKVNLRSIKWRGTYPKPSAAISTANFAAATFTTATGNQYIGGEPADLHFATGTGAGITKIEASKDGSTYEEVYTQSSGAMAQTVLVPVDNGDYIKVTFATTQPTTRVRFRR